MLVWLGDEPGLDEFRLADGSVPFPMHKELRFLLDDPEQDVTGRFAVVPEDLDLEEYVELKMR